MKKFWKRTEGFTLVELIVVIAILGILAGVGTVGYSGYVKKAERANDEALLNEINNAFISACMMNGANNLGRNDVDAELSAGTFTYTAPFEESFDDFYKGGKFKVFEALIYNSKRGVFEETTINAMNIYNIIKENYGEEIALLGNSNLSAYGAEGLLTELGTVIDWAANDFGIAALGGTPYWNAVLSYVGLSDSDFDGGFSNIPDELRYDAVAMTLSQKKNLDEETVGAMLANSTALYAAQNTENITIDGIRYWLGKDSNAMQNSASGNTLAEAGAIYGLYMAYAESKGETFNPNSKDALLVMSDALSDSGFATWINSDAVEAELDAYKASMDIVSGATTDENAKNSVLTNGFDDPELIKALESLMGN